MFKIFLVSILLGFNAFADEKSRDISEHKLHLVKEIDEEIANLQAAKSCVSSATDREGLRACHEQRQKARKQHRADELNEKIHRLEEVKEKLQK